jgi:stage II sporulation protein M
MKKQKESERNYVACWKYLKESKWYIVTALTTFCLFILIGFAAPIFFTNQINALIQEMMLGLEGLNTSETIAYIFFNNLQASFLAIIIGVLFGIFPIITSIFNGYLIGFVMRLAVEENGIFILWRLLPHGIFELPAIILSIGFGIKLGSNLFKKEKKWESIKKDFKESMRFFIFVIIPLLVIAGIIEGVLIGLAG